MSIKQLDACDFEAYSVKDRTAKIQEIIDGIVESGGGVLEFTHGKFLVGSIRLGSFLTLRINAGAELLFSDDSKYFPVVNSRWEGADQEVYQACLYGNNLKNVYIIGEGIIDGNGNRWWTLFRNHQEALKYPRPYLVSLENSEHIVIKDLTLINSPSWTLHPMKSTDILIDGVKVKNPKDSPNTDGLDPESCNNVRIVNCIFDVGDDCIAIKSGTEDASEFVPCRNITISNCNMVHGHGGVVFGSEMSGGIKNVVVANCTFQDTDRGIRFKTRRGRGGLISNIVINDITMDNVLCPLIVNSYYFCGKKGKEKYVWTKETLDVDERTPEIKNLRISNLNATSIKSCAMFIYGLPEDAINGMTVSDVSFEMDKSSDNHESPVMISDAPVLNQNGIFIENTKNVIFKNILLKHAKEIFYQNKNNLNFQKEEIQNVN